MLERARAHFEARRDFLLPYLLLSALLLPAPSSHAQALTIFAAASMKDVIEEMVRSFEAGKGTRVEASFAGSSALARQIERGAPADLFVSADHEWMDYLAKSGRIDTSTRAVLAGNRLVLIAPVDGLGKVEIAPGFMLRRMLGDGRLAVGDPDHVPAGKYARAALSALGVWESVSSKLAPADNVRAALNFVARGEAPLGIVYQTDAAAEARVRIVGVFPPATHPAIEYPVAVVAGTQQRERARRLLAHLRSAGSATVLARHGFVTAR